MSPEQVENFKELETSLHRKEVRNFREQVDALIAEDFMEFGKSGGTYHKQDTLSALEGEQSNLEVEVTDFGARELTPDVVLVTYKTTMFDNDSGTKISTNRSSIWINRGGRWQMTFHQGTKV